jgi:tRNA1(Val) A37 N6-methylase TrmN6
MAGGRQARQNQSGQQQQAQAQRQAQLDTWNRAVSACLEARGYTVR